MTDAVLPLLVYAMLLLAAVLLPYVRTGQSATAKVDSTWAAILFASGAVILSLLRGEITVAGILVLVASSFGLGQRALAGALAACLLLAASIWWLDGFQIPPKLHLLAAAGWLALAMLVRRCSFAPVDNPAPGRSTLLLVGLLLIASLLSGLLTGATNDQPSAMRAWHHWGAYLSPVQPLLSGAMPYRDFPVQYGMGPTLLLSAACGIRDCWSGLYVVMICANALYLAGLGWCALALTRKLSLFAQLLALAALGAATMLWTGYPIHWGNPIMTPSIGGLRFLPLVALVAVILAAEGRAALPRGLALAGHALWLLSLAWSPENGFFATLLWWPWLALSRADAAATQRDRWIALLRGGLLGGLAVIAGYGAWQLVFRAMFGGWIAPADFLLYLSNPPGRLPIFLFGAIWFAAAILALAFIALARTGRGTARRSLYACLLAALAVGSYYLSRSHENNIINLFPFLILVLLAAQSAWPSQFGDGFVRASLAGIIALSAVINFHPFTLLPGSPAVAGLQIGPGALVTRFQPAPEQDRQLLVNRDAAALFNALRKEGNGAVLMFEGNMIMPMADPRASWTGVNNIANFAPLPPQEIRRYVRQGAAQFRRPGWLIAANAAAPQWLELFSAAYDVSESRSQGAYTAWRLVPRNAR